jgi:hypothetical protein
MKSEFIVHRTCGLRPRPLSGTNWVHTIAPLQLCNWTSDETGHRQRLMTNATVARAGKYRQHKCGIVCTAAQLSRTPTQLRRISDLAQGVYLQSSDPKSVIFDVWRLYLENGYRYSDTAVPYNVRGTHLIERYMKNSAQTKSLGGV